MLDRNSWRSRVQDWPAHVRFAVSIRTAPIEHTSRSTRAHLQRREVRDVVEVQVDLQNGVPPDRELATELRRAVEPTRTSSSAERNSKALISVNALWDRDRSRRLPS